MQTKRNENVQSMGPPRTQVNIGRVLCADKVRVKLRYPFESNLFSMASTTVSQRWHSNALFDVDPVLGSTSVPGFAEWSALYSYNRVIKTKFLCNIGNYENLPIQVFIVHSNTDPGTTGITWNEYASGSFNRSFMIGSISGQPAKTIISTITPRKLLGDRMAFDEMNFVGTSTANPADLTYVGIGLQCISNLNNGVQIAGFLEFTVEFFDRKNLQTTFAELRSKSQAAQKQVKLQQIISKN